MDEHITEWVRKARDGDKDAFGRLVDVFHMRVFRVAYGIVGRKEDAEDITQDTFIKAYKAIASLKSAGNFYSWLLRIGVNTSLNYKKSLGRRFLVALEDIAEPIDPVDTPDAVVERREDNRRINAVLAELSPEHRAVLALREFGGFSYEEIANVLSIPLGTVKSRMNHGRDRLRQLLAKEEIQ